METSSSFCFCTLAVGDRYRAHAKLLAQDLQTYMSGIRLCILTDRPTEFAAFPNVLVFKHRLQSVKGYHDKRFVLETALNLFESCMFLDADVRVLGEPIGAMKWSPGITARAGSTLLNHLQGMRKPSEVRIIKTTAQKLKVDLQQVQWLGEFMFVMTRQNGREKEFFQLWQTISYFFESRGLYHAEGCIIGLAAAKVGLSFGFFREDKFPFFKDKIESVRIQTGQSSLQEKQAYFKVHRSIEHPQRSLWQRVYQQISRWIIFHYRVLRLKIFIHQDPIFHQLFG